MLEKYETCEESKAFVVEQNDFAQYRHAIISSVWNAQEVINASIMEKDVQHFAILLKNEKKCLLMILAFFAVGDVFVNKLIEYILKNVKYSIWRSIEIQKSAQEDIHAEVYSLMIEFLAPNCKHEILNCAGEYAVAQKKLAWCEKILGDLTTLLDRHVPLSRIVYVLIITELLFFSSSFCTIFWFQSRNLFPGLCKSNEFIRRDEGTHGRIGKNIYATLEHKLDAEEAVSIMHEAVEIECEFVDAIIPDTVGMNRESMKKYVKYMANNILSDCGYKPQYRDGVCVFSYMNKFAIESRTDFFFKKPTQYQPYAAAEFEMHDYVTEAIKVQSEYKKILNSVETNLN